MGRFWRRLAALVFIALAPAAAAAQAARPAAQPGEAPSTLVADQVTFEGDEVLVATGNVEVFSEGRRLRADRLVYDRRSDRVQVEGNVRLREADGTIVEGTEATFDERFEEGILRSARIILNGRTQIAGAEMIRREGRFNDLRQVTASSCRVCTPGETPLWELRARRVVHDELNGQVYLYNARFRVAGVPIFWMPALRVPDGSEPRVRGFLTPSARSNSELGFGVRLPYFVPLGDHADLTLYPYIAERTRTLEARYRQAFVRGQITARGAVSRDDLLPGQNRGFFFLDGVFSLPRAYVLRFDIETTSDDPYLRDYNFSEKDRLDSAIGVSRIRERERIEAALTYYESLRADVPNFSEPQFVADAGWHRRTRPPVLGGWLDARLIGQIVTQEGSLDVLGRDTEQVRGQVDWQRVWIAAPGLRVTAQGRVEASAERIENDSQFERWQTGVAPTGALTFGYPLLRRSADGGTQLIEPVAQVAWTGDDGIVAPNDDSTAVTLGTGNLFSLNRFPGLDRREEGGRANLGLRWRTTRPNGLGLSLTGGRVYRFDDTDQFPEGSGLSGRRSNWLAQVDVDLAARLDFGSLLLLDDDLDPTLNETRLTYRAGRFDLVSTYAWQRAESSAQLIDDVSELGAFAGLRLSRRFYGRAGLRQDFTADRTNYSELGLVFENDCVRVDLSAEREFRAVDDVEPVTSFAIEVTLAGLGSAPAAPARRCGTTR